MLLSKAYVCQELDFMQPPLCWIDSYFCVLMKTEIIMCCYVTIVVSFKNNLFHVLSFIPSTEITGK